MSNQNLIFGVKSKKGFHYIGKTIQSRKNNDGIINKSSIKAKYQIPALYDIFKNYENISIEPLVFVDENNWYDEKLREVVEHNDNPLINPKWMLEGKRGYWQGRKRDANTLKRLSESKFRRYVEYNVDGIFKKIWNSGQEAAKQIFGDYQLKNGGGKTKLYEITAKKNVNIKKRLYKNSYWFKAEELLAHFNGIPKKLNISEILRRQAEDRRLKRIINSKNRKKFTTKKRYIVEHYNRKTGKLVSTYMNSSEAAFLLKIDILTVNRLCTGKCKPAKDFILKYGEKLIQPIVKYPQYKTEPLERLIVDNESIKGKKRMEEQQNLEIEKRKKQLLQYKLICEHALALKIN